VNTFHDHLAAAPIGFTARAGNFEGADRLQAQALDGANLAGGLPEATHVDNAFMYTPPDGRSPVMGMYLWHAPGARYPDGDPFIAANGADAADIVYHEYTHGLSNRLVVDANGVTTLGDVQAGAMGEGWSDWYAMDYLVRRGLMKDTPSAGELRIGRYVTAGGGLRSQPLDCPAGSTSRVCPGTAGAGRGGYTYGDYGRVAGGGPDVHADGEIWAQTLWDLRTSLGFNVTAPLVTRAMELSPANPSFLDERNAILMADQVVHRGRYRARIWSVFARRGMGWAARTTGGDDAAPVQDFSLPPAAGRGAGG
jgi:hypothetical protein